jgi:RNA polymerase sigma-70 factor (ECF subfamily)
MQKPLEEIIKGCINNDRKCQEMLYHTFSNIMFGICLGYTKNRDEAKDVLQEGFIKVFKNIKKYSGEGSLEGWIRRIMINTSIDFYRERARKNSHLQIEHVADVHEVEYSILETISANEILGLIQKLPEGAKIIFNLYVVEGYTHDEIAKMLDISEGTSKSQFWRAKKLLQQMLNNVSGERLFVDKVQD